MITLKGRDIYSQLRLVSTETELKDKNEVPYWRMAKGKTVFTIREDIKNAFENSDIAEIHLEEDNREIEVDGKKVTAATLAYAGHLSYRQAKAIVKNEGELKQLENSFTVAVAPVKAEDLV